MVESALAEPGSSISGPDRIEEASARADTVSTYRRKPSASCRSRSIPVSGTASERPRGDAPCGIIAAMDTSRIAGAPAFTALPAAELDALAGAMSEFEADAGTRLTTLDDSTTSVYLVEQGEADVLSGGGEVVQAVGPGDTFGEISLILTGQRTATVVARTPMRLLSLSDQDFQRIRARVPEFESALRRLGFERAMR